jgi:hypothetical protein
VVGGRLRVSPMPRLGSDAADPMDNAKAIAATNMKNTGNVGAIVKLTAHWDVTGEPSLKQTKTIKVAYAHSKRVTFAVSIPGSTLDGLQSAAFHNGWCGVQATITSTFGPAH